MPERRESPLVGTLTLFLELPAEAGRDAFVDRARKTLGDAVRSLDPKALPKAAALKTYSPAERKAAILRAKAPFEELASHGAANEPTFAAWQKVAAKPPGHVTPEERRLAERAFRDVVVADLAAGRIIRRIERALERPTAAILGRMRTPSGSNVALVAQTGHSAAIRALAFTEGGARLVTASDDRRVIVWDTATGREVYTWWLDETGFTEKPASVALSQDGHVLVVGGDGGSTLRWEEGELPQIDPPGTTSTETLPAAIGVVPLPARGPKPLAMTLKLAPEVRAALAKVEAPILAAAESPRVDHPYLVVGTETGALRAIHRTTGEVAWSVDAMPIGVTDVAFATESASFTVTTQTGDVYTWDAATGRPAGPPTSLAAPEAGAGAKLRKLLRRRLGTRAPGRRLALRRVHADRPLAGQILLDRPGGMPIGFYDARGGNELVLVEMSATRDRVLCLHEDGSIAIFQRARPAPIGPPAPASPGGPAPGAASPGASKPGISGLAAKPARDPNAWLAELTTWRSWKERHTTAVSLSADGRFVLQGRSDGVVQLLDAASTDRLCHVIGLPSGTWAVSTDEGRYDAPSGGAGASLHWVIDGEPVELDQLKASFFEPFLLAKLLGTRREPLRAIAPFDGKLPPKVSYREDDEVLSITVTDRGTGIGRVSVAINGKEAFVCKMDAAGDVAAERMPFEVWWKATVTNEAAGAVLRCDVRLGAHPYNRRGVRSAITVTATDREESISSRQLGSPSGLAKVAQGAGLPSTLWAIVVGISQYADASLDLQFAASDAKSFAAALQLAAPGVFADRVKLTVLTSPVASEGAPLPTRDNLKAAFEAAAASATSDDVLLVYFAGHGSVQKVDGDDDFFYPTHGLTEGGGAPRRQEGVTGEELEDWIGKIPALKQVLILDTCHSGQLASDLADARETPSSQERALERLRDGTGVFLLAGAAADAVSYETTRYGMGLLTYALLLGMKEGKALRDRFVDVLGLLTYATSEVEVLAEEIARVQRPILSLRDEAVSFDIGKLDLAAVDRIPITAALPVIVRSALHDAELWCDPLRLGPSLDEALRAAAAASEEPPFVLLDCPFLEGAITLAGRYTVTTESLEVTPRLVRGETSHALPTRTGTTDPAGLANLVGALVNDVIAALPEVLSTGA